MRAHANGTLHLASCGSLLVHGVILFAVRVAGPADAGDRGEDPRLRFLGVVELPARGAEAHERAEEEATRDRPQDAPRVAGEDRHEAPDESPPERAQRQVEAAEAAEPAERPIAHEEPEAARPEPASASLPSAAGPEASSDPSPGRPETAGDPRRAAGEEEGARESYLKEVLRKLHEAKRYPPQSRWMREEGTVEVTFTILADGSVTGVSLAASSSHALLDDEAVEMVARAAPFDPFPAEIAKERWKISVPIRFELLQSP